MASIPLAALDIKQPAQQPGPLDQYGKLMQIQNAQQQQQMGQQQIQQNQQSLGATDALNRAFQGAVKVDPNTGQPTFDRNAVLTSVSNAGYGAKVPELTRSFNELDQSAANLQKTQGEVQTATQDYLGGLANSIQKTAKNPDGSYNMALVTPLIAHAATISPQYAAKANELMQQIQQDPNHLDTILNQVIQSSSKQRELAAAETTAGSKQTAANLKFENGQWYDLSSGKPAPIPGTGTTVKLDAATAKLIGQPEGSEVPLEVGLKLKQYADAGVKSVQANGHSLLVDSAGKTVADLGTATPLVINNMNNTPRDTTGGAVNNGVTGQDVYTNMKPGDAAIVKAIVEGRQSPPSSMAQKTPYWQGIMQAVNAVDPQWSEQRAQIRKNFTTGSTANNIGALNTATVHLDTLADAAKEMSNGSFRPGNQVFNATVKMFGGAAPTNFEGVKSAVAGEMAAALKGNATDVEIKNISDSIQAQNSPKQLADYIDTQMHVLNQKLGTYQQRYQQQLPGDTSWSPVLPQAQAVFQKHGIGGPGASGAQASGFSVTAPNGKIYSFQDQASADAFKKKAGIQ